MELWVAGCVVLLAWFVASWAVSRFAPGGRKRALASPASVKWANRVGALFLFVFMPAHLVLSEMWWGKHIHPRGIATVADYYARFGEPARIRSSASQGATVYHLHGHLPPGYIAALPSEPPAYVFDERGNFLEWCRDPGEGIGEAYWAKWPRGSRQPVDPAAFRERFGLAAR